MNNTTEKRKRNRILKYTGLAALGAALYIFIGAIVPYVDHPEVSKKTREGFARKDYYQVFDAKEEGKIISDNGEALEERIRLISQAEDRIILSSFEMHSDTSGKQVMAALMDAADRGVKVQVITDGFPVVACGWGNPYFKAFAETKNIEYQIYNPVNLLKPWTLMARLHDKYLVVDEKAYVLGGRNTYDYFLGDQKGYKNYDWDALVWCEENTSSLKQVEDYFTSIWKQKENHLYQKEPFQASKKKTKEADKELRTLYERMQEIHPDWFDKKKPEGMVPIESANLISNPVEPDNKEPIAFYKLTELMKEAEGKVIFHTPYLICNDWMVERLQEVCKAVPDTSMLTNSVANNGNPFGAMDYADNKGKLLDTGVGIMEYDDGISYHGKCMTIDDDLAVVGSFNWDMRSAYLDTELMLALHGEEITAQLRDAMSEYEEVSLQVIDEEQSVAPEGAKPQEISKKKETRIRLIHFLKWARFLM